MKRNALLLVVAGSLLGCVPLSRGRQMEQRIARLEVENEESARRIEEQRALVKERVAKVDQKIAEVQKKIDELNQAARRSGADLGVQVQGLNEEFAKLRGQLEVENHRLGELERSVETLRTDTEGRLAALKGAGALDEYEARRKAADLQKPDELFALADEVSRSGDKGVARELYQQYVKRWPRGPQAAEAGFRAGELAFDAKRWREALLAFGKSAEDFPKSDVAPDALLGAAEAMVRLEMKAEAKDVFTQVTERYPRSGAAKKAKARLAELFPAPKKPQPRKRAG